MEMMANVGQCVGEVQGFIGMFMEMDMDVKVNIDIDYSEENIQKAIEVSYNLSLATCVIDNFEIQNYIMNFRSF